MSSSFGSYTYSNCLVAIDRDGGYIAAVGMNSTFVLNLTSDQWITGPVLSTSITKQACSTIAAQDTLYVIGGDGLDTIKKLSIGNLGNIQSHQWLQLDNKLLTALRYHHVIRNGDNILTIGGESSSNQYLGTMNVINTETENVTQSGTLALPARKMAVVLIGNTAYSFGGYGSGGSMSSWSYITLNPTRDPSSFPTALPSSQPSSSPTSPTSAPSLSPSGYPSSQKPSFEPTQQPSWDPTGKPTANPTFAYITTLQGSNQLTQTSPTSAPTSETMFSAQPTVAPSSLEMESQQCFEERTELILQQKAHYVMFAVLLLVILMLLFKDVVNACCRRRRDGSTHPQSRKLMIFSQSPAEPSVSHIDLQSVH